MHTPSDMRCVERNLRILLIDDNPEIHRDFAKILARPAGSDDLLAAEAALFGSESARGEASAFELESASQGQEGLKRVQTALEHSRPFAMAFVDMRMPPGWDGIETIRHLWEADPRLQIVICTAWSDYSWADIVQELGETDQLLILKKPFDSAEVCQMALALTAKWTLSRQAELKMDELERLVEQRTAELVRTQECLLESRKLEAIGTLAGGFAHGFNNHMQVITGFTQLAIRRAGQSEPVLNELSRVLRATESATELVQHLLRFSQRHPAQPVELEAGRLLAEMAALLRPLMDPAVALEVDIADEDVRVWADPRELERALLNLSMNGCEAMPDGGTLTLRVSRCRPEDGTGHLPDGGGRAAEEYACFEVTDTGCGIEPGLRDHIFNPFFTTKVEGRNSGLGLATVYGFARQHGGSITVDSQVGQGTTFRLCLPTAPPEDRNATVADWNRDLLLTV